MTRDASQSIMEARSVVLGERYVTVLGGLPARGWARELVLDSRVPDESERAWGSWKVVRSKKTSMRVAIDWDDEFGRELVDIEFLSQDRYRAKSTALFDRTTLVYQRLETPSTANR